MENNLYTFDRVTRLVIGTMIFAAIIFLIIYLQKALVPFFIAWFIAYLINPIVLFVQRILKLKSKIPAIIIVLLLFTCILGVFYVAFVPKIISELQKLLVLINSSKMPVDIKNYFIGLNISSDILSKGIAMLLSLVSTSFSFISALMVTVFVFIYFIFILKDFELISKGAISLIPDKFRGKSEMILGDVQVGMSRYFRGQALVALCVGVLLSVGFSIISLPMGIVLGLFIGILNLVPYLQILGLVPMAIISLLESGNSDESFWMIFGSALIVLMVVQLIQDTIIVPKIMGHVTGLNPAIILLSLSVWGLVLGVVGMIIALPLTSILLSYYKRFVVNSVPEQ